MLKTDEAPASPAPAASPPQRSKRATHVIPPAARPVSHAGFRSPGTLAQHPAIGIFMVLAGSLLFGIIAVNLQTHGSLMIWDMQASLSLHVFALQSPVFVQDVMIVGYYAGEHLIIAIGLLLLVYFVWKRFWPEACMVLIAWLGEGSIWVITTDYFHRARPVFTTPVWHTLTSYGFPSGHTISAVMCYGLIAYIVVPRVASRFWKIVIIVAMGVVIVYIGYSRAFVGDHYPTDVLAGLGLGIAWSGLVYTSIDLIAVRISRVKSQREARQPHT